MSNCEKYNLIKIALISFMINFKSFFFQFQKENLIKKKICKFKIGARKLKPIAIILDFSPFTLEFITFSLATLDIFLFLSFDNVESPDVSDEGRNTSCIFKQI